MRYLKEKQNFLHGYSMPIMHVKSARPRSDNSAEIFSMLTQSLLQKSQRLPRTSCTGSVHLWCHFHGAQAMSLDKGSSPASVAQVLFNKHPASVLSLPHSGRPGTCCIRMKCN